MSRAELSPEAVSYTHLKIAALRLILSCLGSAEARKRRSHPDPERFSDTAEVYSRLEAVPPFGIYKDNYFVTGSSFSGGKLTKNNSDAKFQISMRHRLIKGMLPFHTYQMGRRDRASDVCRTSGSGFVAVRADSSAPGTPAVCPAEAPRIVNVRVRSSGGRQLPSSQAIHSTVAFSVMSPVFLSRTRWVTTAFELSLIHI